MFVTDATHLQWIMNCNGSRLLADYERPADTDTTLRDEGNAFHWLVQEAFEGRLDVREYVEGLVAFNGVAITPHMFQHARDYLIALHPGQMEIVTTWGIDGVFTINGRADHIGHDKVADILYIDDAKYGYSIVEPEHNWTLLSHAVGWSIINNYTPREVKIRIHQPRPYHPLGSLREWVITAEQLIAYKRQITDTMTNPSNTLRTGPHCFKCRKLGPCPSARELNMTAIDTMGAAFTDEISDEVLADEIRLCTYASKMMENRLSALKDMGTYRVGRGKVLPGFGLERTYTNKTWKKGLSADMLKVLTGKELSVPKLVTPSEAKARGVPEMILAAVTERVETGVKLVPFDVSKKADKLFKGSNNG